MHKKLLITFLICAPMSAVANIPSTEYVQQQIATAVSSKVDTSATANQTMAGTYTVSGTLNLTGIAYAPTAELPPLPTDSGDDEELGGSTPSGGGSGGFDGQ